MSDALDPLEAELSALRPHEVSPGLRRGIAEGLAEAPPAPPLSPTAQAGWGWRIALAGGLAAACLAAVVFWWARGRRVEPEQIVRPQPAPPALIEDSEPTLLEYQRALSRSSEELDALLNKHARAAPQPNPELERIGAFTRSEAALHALLGED
jgi:hypothetical protein